MLPRTLFSEEHLIFCDAFDKFLTQEVDPHYEQWEKDGMVSRELWRKAGANGFLCPWAEEKYGGSAADFLYSVVMIEGNARHRSVGFSLGLHNNIVGPYIERLCTQEQKDRWLPGCISGDIVLAIAMSEPGAGSNLAGIKTTAVREGEEWVINGQKTFITNGQLTDLVFVVCRTDPSTGDPHKGISLIAVEGNAPGFRKGINLEKIGRKASDTSELWFDNCRVPASNLVGGLNRGFYHLMENLQQERLVSAIGAQAESEWTLEHTVKYVKEREVFGRLLASYQNTQFKLAEIATEVQLGRVFVDDLIRRHMAGENLVSEISMAKWWVTDMNFRAVNDCLQLFGGYGYMTEYPISRAFCDFRVEMIYAGSNEIMKTIIAKRLGLG